MPVSIATQNGAVTVTRSDSWISRMYDGLCSIPKSSQPRPSRLQKKKTRRAAARLRCGFCEYVDPTPLMPPKPKKTHHVAAWYALYRSRVATLRRRSLASRATTLHFFH